MTRERHIYELERLLSFGESMCPASKKYWKERKDEVLEAVKSTKEGEWFIREYEFFTCDQCGEDVESYAESTQEAKTMLENGDFPNFCPNCGAKMKGKERIKE